MHRAFGVHFITRAFGIGRDDTGPDNVDKLNPDTKRCAGCVKGATTSEV